ncbi:hypothetical protein, partial [Mediterraneibacter gnavus]
MEHIITRRRGFRKLLAFLLCMASILGLLPAQAFAMSVGQTASSWLGDQYVGSDGNHYRAPAPYTYLLWSSIFVTLMANKIGGLQFGIYRN